MSDQREAIFAEMSAIEADQQMLDALNELCYTASETGVIPFSIRGDDFKRIVQLVKMAEKYRDGVPNHLRM